MPVSRYCKVLGNGATTDPYVIISKPIPETCIHDCSVDCYRTVARGGILRLFTIFFCRLGRLFFSESPQIKIDRVGGDATAGYDDEKPYPARRRGRERESGGQSFYREAFEKDSVGARPDQ